MVISEVPLPGDLKFYVISSLNLFIAIYHVLTLFLNIKGFFLP